VLPFAFNVAQDVIDRLAADDRVGLIYIDEYGHRRDYYFAEIAHLSARYAGALRQAGIDAGDRVAVCASNASKMLFALLGLERIAAVPVLCAEDTSVRDLQETSVAQNAKAVIVGRRRREHVDAIRGGLRNLSTFMLIGEEHGGWLRLDLAAERANPLGGESSTDTQTVAQARTQARRLLGAHERDSVWCTLPPGTNEWLACAYAAPWLCGAVSVAHDAPFEPQERLDLVREIEVTILLQNAAEYTAEVLTARIDHLRAPRLYRCICVGDPPQRVAASRWQQATHITIEEAAGGFRPAAS
jgi:acetyl-CoA synthetase